MYRCVNLNNWWSQLYIIVFLNLISHGNRYFNITQHYQIINNDPKTLVVYDTDVAKSGIHLNVCVCVLEQVVTTNFLNFISHGNQYFNITQHYQITYYDPNTLVVYDFEVRHTYTCMCVLEQLGTTNFIYLYSWISSAMVTNILISLNIIKLSIMIQIL